MPGFDGTGPQGQGEMTGGGWGYCVVDESGRGMNIRMGESGFGRRGVRGFRKRFFAKGFPAWTRGRQGMQAFGNSMRSLSKAEELASLRDQASYFQGELDALQARIQELEAK